MSLRKDIKHAINCNSAENGSDTPDFILAEYLTDCLAAYDRAVIARDKWYGPKTPANDVEKENKTTIVLPGDNWMVGLSHEVATPNDPKLSDRDPKPTSTTKSDNGGSQERRVRRS